MKIFNTLTNQKETFEPLDPKQVGMYVCGVTVYDDCHLGHARSAVVFDVIRRYLVFRGYHLKYVRNFTDVDDKIINRAAEEGVPWNTITEKYIQAYYRDMNRLRVGIPDVEPRATQHISEIVEMIRRLVESGYAYQVDGDVYYEVSAYKDYGRLAGRKVEDMLAGARVEVDERKRDPMDFALWKSSKPGEPAWDSPWGKGRPGWHIECSVMSINHLGDTFDIHGGGKDLVFPHHENEIAQSSASTGKVFARYWIHNGFVTIDEEKMSKSVGNFFTIKDLFDRSNCSEHVTAEVLRYFLLSTHYRSDLNFSLQGVAETKAALDTLYDLFYRLEERPEPPSKGEKPISEIIDQCTKAFVESMDDDFNTAKAIGECHQLRGQVNLLLQKGLSGKSRNQVGAWFQEFGEILGLFQLTPKDWEFRPLLFGEDTPAPRATQDISEAWIDEQVRKREEAREKKDFAAADRIRQELASLGITVEDRPGGTSRWKR